MMMSKKSTNREKSKKVVMSTVEVKRLITSCPGLDAAQKSFLRSLLDQSIVCWDSMVNKDDGTLISIDELLLVISDNTADRKEGK